MGLSEGGAGKLPFLMRSFVPEGSVLRIGLALHRRFQLPGSLAVNGLHATREM
jgi:hypothetical protein